jgi:predicted transcriptional regulator
LKKKVHKPPSKIKYDQSHPIVSIRVDQELYDQLKELREKSGKSLGDILREALSIQAPSVHNSYSRGFKAGYKDAEKVYRVDYKCSVCGGNMTVRSVEEKEDIARYMRDKGWKHVECPR